MPRLKRALVNLVWLCGVALPCGVLVRVASRFPLPTEWGGPKYDFREVVAAVGFEYLIFIGIGLTAGAVHQAILVFVPPDWERGRQHRAVAITGLIVPVALIGGWVAGSDYLPLSMLGMATVVYVIYAWRAKSLGGERNQETT